MKIGRSIAIGILCVALALSATYTTLSMIRVASSGSIPAVQFTFTTHFSCTDDLNGQYLIDRAKYSTVIIVHNLNVTQVDLREEYTVGTYDSGRVVPEGLQPPVVVRATEVTKLGGRDVANLDCVDILRALRQADVEDVVKPPSTNVRTHVGSVVLTTETPSLDVVTQISAVSYTDVRPVQYSPTSGMSLTTEHVPAVQIQPPNCLPDFDFPGFHELVRSYPLGTSFPLILRATAICGFSSRLCVELVGGFQQITGTFGPRGNCVTLNDKSPSATVDVNYQIANNAPTGVYRLDLCGSQIWSSLQHCGHITVTVT